LQPDLVVELGTHYGESYFGFCQMVEEHGLSTRCYAIDTWRGDEHAGFYSDAVYQEVNAYNRTHYSSFSSLLRMTFDEAAPGFADASIDLLHIDGFHAYEAVAHDFFQWLPKVKPGGLILLHDVMTRSPGFGAWKLWEDLKQRFPAFAFHHSRGLGVLRIPGPPLQHDALIQRLFASDPSVHEQLRQHYVLLAENLEYRYAVANSYSSGSQVCVTVYTFGDSGYNEHQSQSVLLPLRQWKHISFELPDGSGRGPIRIDPADVPAVIEIAEIQVRAAGDSRVLWQATKETGFSTVQLSPDIEILPGSAHLRCASHGVDPQIILPEIPDAASEQGLWIGIWLWVDAGLRPEQVQAFENRLRELAEDRDRLRRDFLELQQQLTAQMEQLQRCQGQLQELIPVRDQQRADVLALQQQQTEQSERIQAYQDEVRTLTEARDWLPRNVIKHQQQSERITKAEDEIRDRDRF
jgi:hypothetical protein